LTEFYLSKGNNYLSFGGKGQASEEINQFSAKMERERIISEDKLKQRGQEEASGYKYHMIGSQQRPSTANHLSINDRLHQDFAISRTLNDKFEMLRVMEDEGTIEESTIRLQRPEMDDDEDV
jgi:hypothetical protein